MAFTRAALLLTLLLSAATARHRLEPPPGRVVHAGGQEPGCFQKYTAFLGPLGPAVGMFYIGLASLNSTPTGTVAPWFAEIGAQLSAAAAPDGAFLAAQIGLELPLNGGEARVASGEFDAAIEALRFSLAWLARPVWLRVGYEFNGEWNNYTASSYIAAYRRIASVLHADPALNRTVALVWDGSCDTSRDPSPFWPGADVVDWQGVNLFSGASAPTSAGPGSCVEAWLTDSAAAGLPLMIGEATPRGRNTSDAGTLAAWHAPFLALLAAHPHVGLISYIDQDWEVAEGGRWKGWGDSRVEVGAPELQAVWRGALSGGAFVNRMQKAELLALLGL